MSVVCRKKRVLTLIVIQPINIQPRKKKIIFQVEFSLASKKIKPLSNYSKTNHSNKKKDF